MTRRVCAAALALAAVTAAVPGPLRAAEPGQGTRILISANWAGYVASSGAGVEAPVSFTRVSGTWKQPRPSCRPHDHPASAAMWVGLGGYRASSGNLAQIGTSSDCSRLGAASTYAWWEILPAVSHRLRLAVAPGDRVTASVELTPTGLVLRLQNLTTGAVAVKRSASSLEPRTSAEWIAEAPSSCNRFSCSPVALANFGAVTFRAAEAVGDGETGAIAGTQWDTVRLHLVPGSGALFGGGPHPEGRSTSTAGALTGALTAGGSVFSVRWHPNPMPAL